MMYAKVESMLRNDYEVARANRNFEEMTNNYEMLSELWATGNLDSEDYHNSVVPIVCCFAEVKGNKVEMPLLYKSCKQNIGKKVIYSLDRDCIKLITNVAEDKIIFDYFEEEGIKTKYIILQNTVELNTLAGKILQLHNRDIVELCIDAEMIVISKV